MNQRELTDLLNAASVGTILRVTYRTRNDELQQFEGRVQRKYFNATDVQMLWFEGEGQVLMLGPPNSAETSELLQNLVWCFGKYNVVKNISSV